MGIGIECLGILIRCAIVADMEDVDQTNLIGYFRHMLVPLAHLLFPYLLGNRVAVATLGRDIEAVGTCLAG